MKNSVAVDEAFESLVGVQVPRFYFASRAGSAGAGGGAAGADNGEPAAGADNGSRLREKVMLDFVGMEDVSDATHPTPTYACPFPHPYP
jgi:hypothetical protein